jgi:hypothetical protein
VPGTDMARSYPADQVPSLHSNSTNNLARIIRIDQIRDKMPDEVKVMVKSDKWAKTSSDLSSC